MMDRLTQHTRWISLSSQLFPIEKPAFPPDVLYNPNSGNISLDTMEPRHTIWDNLYGKHTTFSSRARS